MSEPALQAAVIAASVALVIGILGQIVLIANQILTHRLTIRREIEKYYGEVYQKLLAPIVADVLLYVDLIANFGEHSSITPQRIEIKDRVIDHVKENLTYGSPQLINSFHNIGSFKALAERIPDPSPADEGLLYQVAQEYVYVINRSSIFTHSKRNNQNSPIYKALILYLLHLNNFPLIVQNHHLIDDRVFSERVYNRIKDRIERMRDLPITYHQSSYRAADEVKKKISNSNPHYAEALNKATVEHSIRYSSDRERRKQKAFEDITGILVKDPVIRKVILSSSVPEYRLGNPSDVDY